MDSNLDGKAKSGETAILCYINEGGITNGAHYINITWDDDTNEYVAHNNYPEKHFESIEEFLYNEGDPRQLISLTVIS